MRNMKLVTFAWIALFVMSLYSCGTTTGNGDPKVVLTSFFQALANRDIDAASKLATQDSKATLDMMKMGLELAKNLPDSVLKNKQKQYNPENIVFGEPKITGDVATVSISSKTEQHPPVDFRLVKENGRWKVDFSMSALMSMGQKAAQAMGDSNHATIQLNTQNIEQGMKMADSVLKHMDPQKLEEIRKQMEKLKQ